MKTKIVCTFALAATFCLSAAGPALAAPATRLDQGTGTCRLLDQKEMWQGYQVFKSVCKECHTRNNDQGAPFLYPEAKTMKSWNRVFTDKYPRCARDGSWEGLGLEDQLRLNDYLYRHAADAYDPNSAADCG